MPDFSYIARDSAGQRVTGTLAAANRSEALAAMAKSSLFPVEVKGDAPAAVNGRSIGRVPANLMATSFGQLADLLRSGVPLLRGIKLLREQTSNTRLRAALEQVHSRVEDGASLAEAMARFPRVFGEMATNMIRAGGEGGFLEDALTQVADFTEKQEDLRKRTLGAVIYPMVLVIIGTIVVTVLVVFFVPKFEGLFDRLRQRGELPLMTDLLLGTSNVLQSWGWLILLALGGIVAAAMSVLRTEAGRLWSDRLKLRLPMAGPIYLNLAVARFCRVLGTLLHNGVSILRALNISRDATGNRVLAQAIAKATENISAGQTLSAPLSASGHFPRAVVEMISVAEESNTLENVLLQIADNLERRTWRRLDLAVRLIEPLLLLILAGVVLAVVVALLLPVLKMSMTLE